MADKECMIKNVDRTFLKSSMTPVEATKKMLKATATTSTGKTKEETIHTPTPKLMSVTWGLPEKERGKEGEKVVDIKEIRKTANGVKSFLCIQSKGFSPGHCFALIVLESAAWDGYFEAHLISMESAGKTKMVEQDLVNITPNEVYWKDKSKKASKISATVYLVTYTGKRWFGEDTPEALAVEFNPGLGLKNPSIVPSNSLTYKWIYLHEPSIKTEIDFDYCGHGMEYRENIFCVKNKQYGPRFIGKTKVGSYPGWNDLIKSGKATPDERKVISVMSENEGELEAVQSYDSEVVSLGAMQKTINIKGEGELPTQIYEFQEKYEAAWEKYECCFKHHQWTFVNEEGKCYAKYKGNSVTQTVKEEVRKGFDSSNLRKSQTEPSLMEPFIKLAHDREFQEKQILDFIKRIRKALSKKISAYGNREISEYIKSPLGIATVLDHDVNRPGQVAECMKDALDKFISSKEEEGVIIDKDSSKWSSNHATYEKAILDIYGPLRGSKPLYTMTDATGRYNKLKNNFK